MTVKTTERRRHHRIPVMVDVAAPLTIRFEGKDVDVPAVLINLSAGGLSMVTFGVPPGGRTLRLDINLPGVASGHVHGKIVRVHSRGATHQVGVQFTDFREKWELIVGKLAEAYQGCEEKLAQGERHFCLKVCAYFPLCDKAEKSRVFPKPSGSD